MLAHLFAFLMLLTVAVGSGALAARAVSSIPQSILAHAEEAGRYALLGSAKLVPPLTAARKGGS